MRPPDEIKAKLDQVLADSRLGYPPANVFSNAPLALIQLELETKRDLLRWVLDEAEPSARLALEGE